MTALVSGDRKTPWAATLPISAHLDILKYCVLINQRVLSEDTPPDRSIRYIDIGSVDELGRIGRVEDFTFENAPSRARRVPLHGDTIVSTVRTYLKAIAYIDSPPANTVCSTGFAVLTPGQRIDSRFLGWWIRSQQIVDEICARSVGVSYPGINALEIGCLPVPILPLEQQRGVAAFLDGKTAAIDKLIENKERLIELLREKQQALITQAVTRGIAPNVPMKESGVDWVGPIPAHWRVLQLKRLARSGWKTFTDGDWIEAPFIASSGVRLVQTGNIGIGVYREQGYRYVSHKTFRDLRCTEVAPGDVLICRLDGPVGRACLAPNLGVKMITSVDNAILKASNEHDSRFVVQALSARPYLEWVQSLCRVGGGFRFRISRSMLGDFRIPVPPFAEQKTIADELEQRVKSTDAVVTTVQRQIDQLAEYRQALISAAVTGQFDVSKEAA